MAFLIDTNIAIYLRDGDPSIRALVDGLGERPSISAMTRIELEGGIHSRPDLAERRRRALDILVRELPIIDVTEDVARSYGKIIARSGFSRRKIADRIIAATAMSHGLTFVTLNSVDFQDISGLDLIAWTTPA